MKQQLKTTMTISAISMAMSLAVTASTFAAPTCGTHKLITTTLATQYNEIPLHRGLTPKGTMVEIFSSKAGTFTVVVTVPTGMSCLVTAGTNWQEIDAASHGNKKNTSGGLEREF